MNDHAHSSYDMDSSIFTPSWDDGSPLDTTVADLLKKYDFPGTFYIPAVSEFGIMPQSSIRTISNQFEVGAHTSNHVVLTGVNDNKAIEEIKTSKDFLQDITGKPCDVFCFPQGKFKRNHLKFVKSAGFLGVRTVELLSLSLPRFRDGLWIIPTTIQVYSHTDFEYIKNSFKRKAFTNLSFHLLTLRKDWKEKAEIFLLKAIQSKSVFHLWGHSWEIEKYSLWQELDEFLGMVNQYRQQIKMMTNGELCHYVARDYAGTS